MNYLFVIKFFDTNAFALGGKFFLPAGVVYVATCLKQNNENTYGILLDLYEDEDNALKKTIIENNIDILCVGGLSLHLKNMRNIIDAAKSVKPEIKIIVGGGFVSS